MRELSAFQFEAITWAMFGIENEIQHLEYLLGSTESTETEKFLRDQLKRRKLHFQALKELIEGTKEGDHAIEVYDLKDKE